MSRVNMNINEELLARIDSYAEKNYMTRSAVMCFAVNQFLVGQETKEYYQTMLQLMKEFALRGTLNDEQKQILEQVEKVCAAFDVEYK